MMDRLLGFTLNFTVVTMTTALACGGLVCGYWGLMDLLGGHAALGGELTGTGIALAIATCLLARYRNELADRY